MAVARTIAKRATCGRLHVGAVITVEDRIVATGYNGSPRGMPHCDDVGHLMVEGHCVRTVHAEKNAIANASAPVDGGTVYVTHSPCVHCTNYLIQCGILRVVVGELYGDFETSVALLETAGIPFEVIGERR